jgi:hypothetical protein
LDFYFWQLTIIPELKGLPIAIIKEDVSQFTKNTVKKRAKTKKVNRIECKSGVMTRFSYGRNKMSDWIKF